MTIALPVGARTKLPSRGSYNLLLGFLLHAAGCGSDMSPPANAELEPPPAGLGRQYAMTSDLMPGQEIERCQFFVAPPGGFYVNHDQVRYTPGSHHVLLYLTPYTSVPTTDSRGQVHDTSGVFDCASGATADWQVTGVLSGAQSTAADSMVNLPPDVAIKVPAGSVMLMNTHYLNASPNPVTSTARINVYTIPQEQVKTEGGVILFYNPFIRIPALGRASARMRCPVPTDLTLATVQSHMHRRGVGYVADWRDGSGALLEQLYQSANWEAVPVKMWSPGKQLRAGTMIDYRCDYASQESHTILQGQSTRDEMCVLLGSYYPRNPEFESCIHPTWVGSGTASGADTLACVQAAGSNDAMDDCMVSSCPAIATQLTAALECQFSQGQGSCQSTCAADPTQCQACIAKACQGQLAACVAASCQ